MSAEFDFLCKIEVQFREPTRQQMQDLLAVRLEAAGRDISEVQQSDIEAIEDQATDLMAITMDRSLFEAVADALAIHYKIEISDQVVEDYVKTHIHTFTEELLNSDFAALAEDEHLLDYYSDWICTQMRRTAAIDAYIEQTDPLDVSNISSDEPRLHVLFGVEDQVDAHQLKRRLAAFNELLSEYTPQLTAVNSEQASKQYLHFIARSALGEVTWEDYLTYGR